MGFVLVRVWLDLGVDQQVLDLFGREVGDADVAGQVGVDQVLHRVPGGEDAGGVVEVGGVRVEGYGPVHEVEVQVGGLEVGERFLQGRPDEVGAVVVVPEFRGDPVGGARAGGGVEGGADVVFVSFLGL